MFLEAEPEFFDKTHYSHVVTVSLDFVKKLFSKL